MAKTNHNTWKKTSYSLGSLHPDLQNPRLTKPAKNDTEAYKLLAEQEGVSELAKEVVSKGYMPVEDLVVIKENNKIIVIEGNRRLAMLKMIKDPGLAPKSLQKRFQKYSTEYSAQVPGKIHVVIAPDRIEANVYVYMKHTPNTFFKKWDKVQQAFFIDRLLSRYPSVDEALEREDQISKGDAKAAKLTVAIFNLIPLLSLSDNKKNLLSDPENFPYSTVIERLLDRPSASKHLGIRSSLKNGIDFSISQKDADRLLTSILNDATDPDPKDSTGKKMKLDTRELGTSVQQVNYMESKNAPTERGKWQPGAVLFDKDLSKTTDEPPEDDPKPKPKKKKPGYRNGLFIEKLEYTGRHCERLPSILKELQSHEPISSHVNSSSLLLRTAVELAMIAWLKKNRKFTEVTARAKNKKIGPMMSEMINEIQSVYKTDLGLEPQELNAVKLALNNIHFDTMNAYVHNPNYPPSESSVKALCVSIYPLLKVLLA